MPPDTAPARRIGSDSLTQRQAEVAALAVVAQELGLVDVQFQKRFVSGPGTAIVDAFTESNDEVVIIEVNARVGTAMKTATMNKVLKDTLKMMLIEKTRATEWQGKRVRKVLVFLDPVARGRFGPKAWANQAWLAFGVETHVCVTRAASQRTGWPSCRHTTLRSTSKRFVGKHPSRPSGRPGPRRPTSSN